MMPEVVPLLPDSPGLVDGDDATFLPVPPGSDIQYAANIGTVGIDPTTVTRVTVRLRLLQEANEFGEGMDLYVLPTPYTFNDPRTFFSAPNVPPETISTVDLDLFTSFGVNDPIATEPAHLAEFLAADSYVMAFVNSSSSPAVTVYDAAVLIYTTDDDETYRRIFPVDRQRNWPPSKTVRAGNRTYGGYL